MTTGTTVLSGKEVKSSLFREQGLSLYFHPLGSFLSHWIQLSFAGIPVGASLAQGLPWPAGAQRCPGSWTQEGVWECSGTPGRGAVVFTPSWLNLKCGTSCPWWEAALKRQVFEMHVRSDWSSKFRHAGGLVRQLSSCLMVRLSWSGEWMVNGHWWEYIGGWR